MDINLSFIAVKPSVKTELRIVIIYKHLAYECRSQFAPNLKYLILAINLRYHVKTVSKFILNVIYMNNDESFKMIWNIEFRISSIWFGIQNIIPLQ